ncbi:MAG: plasmid recombination protein [Deltaproteobacteria bacterium]|nr:plasmid recombination protein [Deltaproteobacteria bacterium]
MTDDVKDNTSSPLDGDKQESPLASGQKGEAPAPEIRYGMEWTEHSKGFLHNWQPGQTDFAFPKMPNWTGRYKTLKSIDKVDWYFDRMCGLEKKSIYYGGPSMFLLGNEYNNPSSEIVVRLARRTKKPGIITLALGGCYWITWVEPYLEPEFTSKRDEFNQWMEISLAFLKERFGQYLINVSVQLDTFPHMHFMVLTTGTEGQAMAKHVCAPGLYFRMLNRQYIDYFDRKLGRPVRFPEPCHPITQRKAKRYAIAQYCRIKDRVRLAGPGPIRWTKHGGTWLWDRYSMVGEGLGEIDGQRVTIGDLLDNCARDLSDQDKRFLYAWVLWERGLVSAVQSCVTLILEGSHRSLSNSGKDRLLKKYLVVPKTAVRVKGKLFFGGRDVDLGEILTGSFGATLIEPGPYYEPLSRGLNLAAQAGLASLSRYEPMALPYVAIKFNQKLHGLYDAQARIGKESRADILKNRTFERDGLWRYIPKIKKKTVPVMPSHYILPDGGFVTTRKADWYDHRNGKAGVGSVTLTEHLTDLAGGDQSVPDVIMGDSFRPHFVRRSYDFYRGRVLSRDKLERYVTNGSCPAPPSHEALWPQGRAKLLERGLEGSLVDRCHGLGLVYANHNGYLVFPCQGEGFFILICGCYGPGGDTWWWPSKSAGPFVLDGDVGERARPEDSLGAGTGPEGVVPRKPKAAVLTDNPLTALKVKARDFEKLALAVGPGFPANGLVPRTGSLALTLAAQTQESYERLENLTRDLAPARQEGKTG